MAYAVKIRPMDSIYTQAWIAQARSDVDQIFDNAATNAHAKTLLKSFVGWGWLPTLNPIKPKKEAAVRAVLARRWHAKYGPASADLQPLPIGYEEREFLKRGGAPHILAWYARSLANLGYDVAEHPPFQDYACGVMACQFSPSFTTQDPQLQRRFPPRQLPGLDGGLIWVPPKNNAGGTSTPLGVIPNE